MNGCMYEVGEHSQDNQQLKRQNILQYLLTHE